MNAVDSNLYLYRLRERGLQAIAGKDFSHLPRRFWVGRQAGQARSRALEGEGELLEMLALFGFEEVAIETLTPLEQIAIMANAEVLMSYHGAGFANMLFAKSKTHVVEQGTLQPCLVLCRLRQGRSTESAKFLGGRHHARQPVAAWSGGGDIVFDRTFGVYPELFERQGRAPGRAAVEPDRRCG